MHRQTATQLMTYLEESGSKWERKGLSYMPGRLKDWAYMRAHNSKMVKNDKLNKKKEIYMLQDIT